MTRYQYRVTYEQLVPVATDPDGTNRLEWLPRTGFAYDHPTDVRREVRNLKAKGQVRRLPIRNVGVERRVVGEWEAIGVPEPALREVSPGA